MPKVGPDRLRTCRSHGSANARSRRKAERNKARVRIGAFLSQQGKEIDNVDPLEVLLYQLGWASGAARALGRLVSELEEVHGPNHTGTAVPHVLVRMWSEERDRAARLAKMAIDAGLAEKQVRLAERQGQVIAHIFTSVLDDDSLGLSREQRDAGRSLAARHLRALEP